MTTLGKYYAKGLIQYPRVENGYIKDSLFSYFPHPELDIVNNYFEPLKNEEYKIDENSFLLHLHNLRYINISQVPNVQKRVKGKIDSKKSDPILNDKDKLLRDNYKKFLDKKEESLPDYFIKNQLEHYSKNKPTLLKIDYENDSFLEHIIELNDLINPSAKKEDVFNVFDDVNFKNTAIDRETEEILHKK
ncbi:hypothetical protein [Poseidonibacter ostreae]|uniref:Uncharacterized protein n=1 Tax=Poseidonibacter ostreae TaxID=2654171 RepID=A0A6L4WWR4_9BACT|nr:hypothetical protein [Poseidonibacter ostreae]KAB7891307.1 hypothetical protein GBG19_00290 [Poseidonibacter ostreae]